MPAARGDKNLFSTTVNTLLKINALLYETIFCRGVFELLYDSLEITKFHYGLVLQMCIGSSTKMVF